MIDNKAFYNISSGLYLVSTTLKDVTSSCIINTFLQVASAPRQVMISLNKENYTHAILMQSKCFHIGVLSRKVDMSFIQTFGFQSSKDCDKMANYESAQDTLGNRFVSGYSVSDFVLKVTKTIDVGSHTIFLAEVIEATKNNDDEVLTYEYYQKVLKGTTPPKAASYTESTKKGYRCPICGYIAEMDSLPEGFVCPICQAPASIFERIG